MLLGLPADLLCARAFFLLDELMSQLSYAAAGVSIDAGDELVERIKPAAKRTLIPGVLGSIGGFGAFSK